MKITVTIISLKDTLGCCKLVVGWLCEITTVLEFKIHSSGLVSISPLIIQSSILSFCVCEGGGGEIHKLSDGVSGYQRTR